MITATIWILAMVIAYCLAKNKNRDVVKWTIITLVFPLAVFVLLILGDVKPITYSRRRDKQNSYYDDEEKGIRIDV